MLLVLKKWKAECQLRSVLRSLHNVLDCLDFFTFSSLLMITHICFQLHHYLYIRWYLYQYFTNLVTIFCFVSWSVHLYIICSIFIFKYVHAKHSLDTWMNFTVKKYLKWNWYNLFLFFFVPWFTFCLDHNLSCRHFWPAICYFLSSAAWMLQSMFCL